MIANALRRIQEEGGEYNFVIFVADQDRNYYIQVTTRKGNTELRAEAVSNDVLTPEDALSNEQTARLESMGWNDQVDGNYYRYWEASSDEKRSDIAEEVMRTFIEGYGISPDTIIEIEMELEVGQSKKWWQFW